jgi:Flp pilus assembly protein TadB
VELAKFILTIVATFVSLSALMFSIFQFWAKKQEKKDEAFKAAIRKELDTERVSSKEEIEDERASRKEDVRRLETRIEKLESIVTEGLIDRLSKLEGEMKGIRDILNRIQDWFIRNTSKGV